MNIKGHAIIELKDVATGEIQRVEHDNMVTNGLKYCLTPWLGKFSYATGGSSPQIMIDEATETRKNNNRSMMNHLLGGIFLFQNNLEENADNTAFPLDNPLTGKASWDAYNGMDTYRGSYNENESGLQEDGSYKHVWDFATSQANGQISALALTTYKGGICGCGYKEWDSTKEKTITETPYFDLGQIRINKEGEGGHCSPFINPSSNEIYYVADQYCLTYTAAYSDRYLGNAGKLFMKKKKFPLNRLSPFYDYYNQYHIKEIEIELPKEYVDYVNSDQGSCQYRGRTSDNYLYIYKYMTSRGSTTISPGDTFKIMRIKKDDLSVDAIALTNSTPSYISTDLHFTDEFCFTGAQNYAHTYRINISDNEITEIKGITGTAGTNTLIKIGDYIYYSAGNKYNYCINPKTLETKYHPTFTAIATNKWYASTEKIAPGIYLQFWRNTYSSSAACDYANIYISTNTLMTINNLPSPVVKTAAQTMKVTYTIQETEA